MANPVPRILAFSVTGPIEPGDLAGLCDRVCGLLAQHRPAVARCDVGTVKADAVTVDALARLQLAARRYGCRVVLLDASADLLAIVELMGLADVLGPER